jgi:hypothetical protein
MSNLNLDFLKTNFGESPINFFDIGCANMFDTIIFKSTLEDFDLMMKGYNYIKMFVGQYDTLYVHETAKIKNNRYKNLI